jgi:hypothetical protein
MEVSILVLWVATPCSNMVVTNVPTLKTKVIGSSETSVAIYMPERRRNAVHCNMSYFCINVFNEVTRRQRVIWICF